MDIRAFITDEDKETNGFWYSLGDARFKIARWDNPNYKAAMAKALGPVAVALRVSQANGYPLDHFATAIEAATVTAMAKAVLLDWEGMTDGGEPFPYNRENAERALQAKDFRDIISDQSSRRGNFLAEPKYG